MTIVQGPVKRQGGYAAVAAGNEWEWRMPWGGELVRFAAEAGVAAGCFWSERADGAARLVPPAGNFFGWPGQPAAHRHRR